MFETYEEKAGKALDTLYPGALFLAAGVESEAERLLIDTVAGALHSGFDGVDVSIRWFEARLALHFFEGTQSPTGMRGRLSPSAIPPMDGNDLLRGAAAVPPWARPALWLVLLRQWSYGETREALGVSSEALQEMLGYRATLASATLGRPERLDRSGGSAR